MFIYEVVADGEAFLVNEPFDIVDQFGMDVEVTRYQISNPRDVTDIILGGLWHELD